MKISLSKFHSLVRQSRIEEARSRGTHTKEEWEELCEEFDYRCLICWKKPKILTKDHILPLYTIDYGKEPDDTIYNIQPLCAPCNIGKSVEYLTNWKETRRMQKIFPYYRCPEEIFLEAFRKEVRKYKSLRELSEQFNVTMSGAKTLRKRVAIVKIGT